MPTDETLPSLKPSQIRALVVLMAEARELNNKELAALAGESLTGAENTQLVKLGLVETDRSKKPFSHSLTDRGWHFVREIHTTAPPKGGASLALFTLLANVNRSLDRLQVSYAEFFKQAPAASRGVRVEAAVRSAYASLATTPGAWVGLAELRERLPEIERGSLDDTLRAMAREKGVRIIPVADIKNLELRDRAAALRIGTQDNHVIAIELS